MPRAPLAVLDLVPVSSGSNNSEALRNAVDLARVTERAGYQRYWFAEHHLNPGVIGISPALCIALVDVNIPPQESDRLLLDFLNASDRESLIIATKADRLSNNQLNKALNTLASAYPAATVIPFSAKTGQGRDEVWSRIRHTIAEFSAPSFQS